jgi:cellobiose phosphorylase
LYWARGTMKPRQDGLSGTLPTPMLPRKRWRRRERIWDERLSAITVSTPDMSMDIMLNRWLVYQTLSCRIMARTGFYQAGGAFGFRDQLTGCFGLGIQRSG